MLNLPELGLRANGRSPRVERPGSAGAQAFAALRHAVVTLKRRPGQSFSEQEVAQRLGVSRSPVREAVIRLARADRDDPKPNALWLPEPRRMLPRFAAEGAWSRSGTTPTGK
jgi:hypothetical protein